MYGDSLKSFLVSVIVPDEEVLTVWAQENGIEGTFSDWVKDSKVKDVIFKDMLAVGKEVGLQSFEQVKDIYLTDVLFSIENDLLTPTFKLKRNKAKEYFLTQINEMIEKVHAQETEKERSRA